MVMSDMRFQIMPFQAKSAGIISATGRGKIMWAAVHGERQENVRTIEGYIRMMNTDGSAAVREHQNTFQEDVEEYVFMGMRMMKGLDKRDFIKRFDTSMEDLYKESIDKHVRDGLLLDSEETLRFTEKGIEFSNHVLSDFLLST